MGGLIGLLESVHSVMSLIFMLLVVMGLAWIYAWNMTHFLISAVATLWLPLLLPRELFWKIDIYSPEGGAYVFLKWLEVDYGMGSRACYIVTLVGFFSAMWLYVRFEKNWAIRYKKTFIPWATMMEYLED
jgi:hypothetical protein